MMMTTKRGKTAGRISIFGAVLAAAALASAALSVETDRRIRRNLSGEAPVIQTSPEVRDRSGDGARYAENRVLIRFKPGITIQGAQALLKAYGTAPLERIPHVGVHIVPIPDGVSVKEFLGALKRNPDVLYAEPDFSTRLALTPNDEFFWRQYALSNTGNNLRGVPGAPTGKRSADIKATAAWEETQGDPDVIIAVLDTGVDMNHPDLINKLVSRGRDFVNDDNDASDDHWHGTHVAGIAGAETNNTQGIAGVAWKCPILPVKVVDNKGVGYYSWLIQGIIYAVQNGAQVINISLGGDDVSDSLRDTLKFAYEENIVIVAAAGNEAGPVLYPAAYTDYALAVAATDSEDQRTAWSNTGAEVDVAAPGDLILSLVPTWYFGPQFPPYAYASGTSMAAPHVAGMAALVRSLKPWLKAGDVMNIIRYSAEDVNADEHPGRDDHIGYGRINMEKAIVPLKLKTKF
ncbi:MAG: S8 family peptidase [Acidobacteriota bacterium]|nr:S8 family peptidase [Acidobacteriota bacterium]